MVADSAYWGNKTAIAFALMREKDEFFPMKNVDHDWLTMMKERRIPVSGMGSVNNAREVLQILEEGSNRDKKWITSWTSGLSLANFKLRAYCNMHQDDPVLPHVYPLRVLGITPRESNFTVPCPYWSCVLTEARPGGKLSFYAILAFAAFLHGVHFRLDCYVFVHFLGSGQRRAWWMWFWACLLPLWLVLLIKTTHEAELSEEVVGIFSGFELLLKDSPQHVFLLSGMMGGCVLCYIFRDRVRKELGLDDNVMPLFFPKSEKLTEHTFQVCVWRIDVNSQSCIAKFHQMDSGLDDSFASSSRGDDSDSSARMLAIPAKSPSFLRHFAAYLPLSANVRDGESLHTADGHPPALCVRFFYGGEEVQSTRIRHVSYAQWSFDGVVDFCENFTISVNPKPRTMFRVDVRDHTAASISLGSVSFDENRLKKQFERSEKMEEQGRMHLTDGSMATEQVAQMMEQRTSNVHDDVKMARMCEVGFVPHRLSEGGAIWLAIADVEEKSDGLGIQLFC